MICCGEKTSVTDSRSTADGAMRRRRVCGVCGARFSTIETRLAANTPQPSKPQQLRRNLRKHARAEAVSTGEDVKLIYARWGCE